MTACGLGQLLPGPRHFQVQEEPAYEPSGCGEHLFVEVEKVGLTTDEVAAALARACGVPLRAVGFAGRKDRHAIARQWFSIHTARETGLARLALPEEQLRILRLTRHRNKLRLGHLRGNRFRLGLHAAAPGAVQEALQRVASDGIVNRFGPQRFGVQGVNRELALAWGRGDAERAVALIVDPSGAWRWGDPLPAGFRSGPEGRVLAALRRGAPARAALRAAPALRALVASAAQALICNAVIDARQRRGLLHVARAGDILCTARGAPFRVRAEELATVAPRLAPGCLALATTAPLPGRLRLQPEPAIAAEERAWSADTGIAWEWFDPGGPLASPGGRRPCVVAFRSPPTCTLGEGVLWAEFSLPPGVYATAVLAQAGIVVPEDRSGREGAA
ncbi:MAG: tRNA pseudouridine(13) synthase TruD [Planctomycetota bacterium]|nr:tRNA pseudouridine(13) synthase TruD [Planctomycetota bacterium]